MPTGYTSDIPKGITFQEYAMGCARAFGALVMMRDDPQDKPIPDEFKPSDHHSKALSKARDDLRAVSKMSESACNLAAKLEFEAEESDRLKRLDENQKQMESYRAMLAKAKKWAPPSPDHIEMKRFMVDQIEKSIEWDDSSEYLSKPPERLTGVKWREMKMEKSLKDINYHEEEYEKEVKRTSDRNRWVKQLRASLA